MGSSVILPPQGQPAEGPDTSFHSAAVPNIITFTFSNIAPPSTLYIQRDDRLHVKIKNSVAGMGYIISARLLMPIGPLPGQPDQPSPPEVVTAQQGRGWINTIQQELFPTANRVPNEFDIILAEGYLIDIAVAFDGSLGTVNRGQAYITAGLQRGVAGGFRFMQLIADSPGIDMDLGWPGGSLRAPTEGPGFIHTITVGNPAAAADWSFTIPAGARMKLRSAQAQLATSATVANRFPFLHLTDSVNEYALFTPSAAQVASLTVVYHWSPGATQQAVISSQEVVATLSDMVLPPGHVIASTTPGISAGDQWSAIVLSVEEWINA